MFTALLLSSAVSGLIGTAVMVAFLYLPIFWRGAYYDTLGALGSMFTRVVDERSRLLGGLALLGGGVLFAGFYGAFVLMFTQGPFPAPDYTLPLGMPVEVNLFYPLLGLIGGFSQGIFVSLITTFFVTDFHPLPALRTPFTLILSFLVGHVVYGTVVMFFQHQLLQLLL